MDTTTVNSTHATYSIPFQSLKEAHRRRVSGEVVAFSRQTGELLLRRREKDKGEFHQSFVVTGKTETTYALRIGKKDRSPIKISRRLDGLEPGREVIIDYHTVDGRNRVLVICYRT